MQLPTRRDRLAKLQSQRLKPGATVRQFFPGFGKRRPRKVGRTGFIVRRYGNATVVQWFGAPKGIYHIEHLVPAAQK
ncbi:hypothetical protein [Stutzerimonas nitrititolerans]|uniref:hypothetical protein n=1 Tax=Stutzerimonas nitrititolerans TaxID=2482751 RepID=UPI00289DC1F7|nr:hypothetical protein [Stutzerimonas nitrititolerans]